MLWLGTHVPLYPGAIVDRHVGFATEEGPQDHVAGCDTGATCGYQRLGQVHLLLLKQALDLLWALLQTFIGQEFSERDVYRARDVARFDACTGGKNTRKASMSDV